MVYAPLSRTNVGTEDDDVDDDNNVAADRFVFWTGLNELSSAILKTNWVFANYEDQISRTSKKNKFWK